MRDRYEDQEPPRSLDTVTTRLFGRFSQRYSRRSALGKIGKLSLAALGVSIVQEILPVDRRMAAAATVGCNHKSTCGLTGSQCGCSDCSGSNTDCPSCACLGNSWVCCCCDIHDCDHYRYLDCFNTGSCPPAKLDNCNTCPGCANNPNADIYRGNPPCNGAYLCTRIRETTGCTTPGC